MLPIVGIVRTQHAETALQSALTIARAGLVPEITLTVPDAARIISRVREETDAVYAGTVLSSWDAKQCVEAGATALVAPNVDRSVIETAVELGVPAWPGAATPSELALAMEAGAAGVKLFPITMLGGADFVRMLKGPFPSVRLMATGGVELESVRAFLDAGCELVGVGGDLGVQGKGDPDKEVSALVDRLALAGLASD